MSTQPPTQDDIRSAWNTIAPHFDEFVTPENIRDGEAVLSRLDIGPGTRLLDVCCGSGALSIPAALRGADVTAVDLAPVMIDRLTTRADEAGLVNITPQVADSHALDLPDGHFDVAVSQHGVTMSPAMDKPLAEMARVTRAGGIVLVSAFAPPSEVEVLAVFMAAVRSAVPSFTGMPTDPPPPPFQLADPDTFRSRMTAAELSDVHIERVTEERRIESATHLWDGITSSHPITNGMVAGLSESERADVLQVLDGVLRERSGGSPGAVLHAALNVGTGTV